MMTLHSYFNDLFKESVIVLMFLNCHSIEIIFKSDTITTIDIGRCSLLQPQDCMFMSASSSSSSVFPLFFGSVLTLLYKKY